ncbi:MAG TPA: alpha-amylase family glycosyl hydrolase [Azospirillum sp.]|nr:alpha-amylase family glycosyl hydrolase [Azospirillum sp.]
MMPLPRALPLALLLAATPADAATLALKGDGGDAWTFSKAVEGTAPPDACDEVLVASPGGVMPAERDGERFFATIRLHEGGNEVRALCRRDGAEQAVSEAQHWTVRVRDVPKAWVRTAVTDAGLVLDAGRSEPALSRPAPVARVEWRAEAGNPAPLLATDGSPVDGNAAKRLTLRTPAADGTYRVSLRVTDALGRTDTAAGVFRVEQGKPVAVDLRREPPAWSRDAVVYGVVPWLFGPRGLPDVTARLDAIAELGVNTLWLSPITGAPGDDFGYAVTDHFGVRERFGSEADLKTLVAAAHARGLRVLMDVVPNHTAEQHPYYADAAARGEESPYHAFFDRGTDGDVTHYFDWKNLKNLNYDHPEVQRYMTEAFVHWVREVGIDGFRVDASWAVRERAPEFWPRLREELKRINPDVLLLAESTARDPWYVTHGFDAAYDWTDRLGQWAWHDAFDDPALTATKLRAALSVWDGRTPVFRFLNNNDTGARFITRHGVERARLAATMLMTLPGLPCVYAGDEVGAEYEPYGGPRAIDWTDTHGLTGHYKRLIALRLGENALRSNDFRLVPTSLDDRVLAYRRGDVLVVLNHAEAAVVVALDATGRMDDLLTGETLTLSGTLTLPAHGVRVLKPTERRTAER